MDYTVERLRNDTHDLDVLWSRLEAEWENPSDFEDLYRIYPLFIVTASIARMFIGDKKIYLNIVRPTLNNSIDTSKFWYSDEKKFLNGKIEKKKLGDIISLFLHLSYTVYSDNRGGDGKMRNNTKIYCYIQTDQICKSCSILNYDKFKPIGKNYRNTVGFIWHEDCLCGVYIEVRSYISSLKELIDFLDKKNHS